MKTRLSLIVALGMYCFASSPIAHAQPIKADTGEVAIGRSVSGSTINIGIPAEQVAELVRRARAEPVSLLQTLGSAWKRILAILSVFYATAFAMLLLATRRYAWAFRILSDKAWAKWLTWPFFLIRHLPAVQRWVLEPWFQAVRRSIRTDVPFFDPPVTTAHDQTSSGASVLNLLPATPRIWLQGRAGMGKSSVFACWERDFFTSEGAKTLGAAVRQYGFILIMLQERQYAAVSAPEGTRPESWVLEATRRKLEEFGFHTRDLQLVDDMLRTGQIGLVLDGANEADRDSAITAFAQQFRQVPMLVTSQSTNGDDWQVWHLPENVGALREGLLALWLGAEKGATLSRRIIAEGLSDSIVSGYDLRLVADLAGADPERASLPSDRITLYRAMLARVTGADSQPLRFDGLKQLAWTMMTQRRRQIVPEDEKLLGPGTLNELLKQGVRIVRQIGALHEFRHDQMRAFLAALWLVEESPTPAALARRAIEASIFSLNRRDQEELWQFVAPLVSSEEDIKALWSFANEEPEERVILLSALQSEADDRSVTLVRTARRRRSRTAPVDASTRGSVDRDPPRRMRKAAPTD